MRTWQVVRTLLGSNTLRFLVLGVSCISLGSFGVNTFLPHIPLNEQSLPAMQIYLNALKAIPGATPSTFSIIGYLSGQMFVQALQACGPAPTRSHPTTTG